MNHIRWGLCCKFNSQDIKFKTTTIKSLRQMSNSERIVKYSEIAAHNIDALYKASEYCVKHNILCFRITSRLFPCYTSNYVGYTIHNLNNYEEIIKKMSDLKVIFPNMRYTFHPDQFCVLNSPDMDIVINSIIEIESQCYWASIIGADVVNIHVGGKYDCKEESINRFIKAFDMLSDNAKKLLTIENDDKSYTVDDTLKISNILNIPVVFDIHHHRCNGDDADDIFDITKKCISTWSDSSREPLFHISSPKIRWGEPGQKRPHSDYINISDFPECWMNIDTPITIEVEAKHKEDSIKNLREDLNSHRQSLKFRS